MSKIDISVIMPCYNEEDVVHNVLSSLTNELDSSEFSYEIVFCDNGSTDKSVSVAEQFPVYIVNSVAETVAGVRNDGVAAASGKMLIFLDADIVVGPGWGEVVQELFQKVINSEIIIGSHPSFPDSVSPILHPWYIAISNDLRNTHLGTGHMMLSTVNFYKIGGFDNSLVTGEDYDFCVRAKQRGMSIVTEMRLIVCHIGYPANVFDFAKREIWHGEGDFKILKSVLKSKVALAALCFNSLLLLSVIMVFFNVLSSIVFFIVALIVAVVAQYYKFGFNSFWSSVSRSYISCVYLFCRGVSPFFMIFKKINRY